MYFYLLSFYKEKYLFFSQLIFKRGEISFYEQMFLLLSFEIHFYANRLEYKITINHIL